MERIYQHYHSKDVEVMTIISGVTDEYSRNRLPSFSQDYKASYTALDDPKNSVVALYALDSTDLRTPQVLIIDKEGIVHHVGKVTPWTQMADEIEQLRGRTEELNLSGVELALQSLKNPDGYVRWKAAEALGKMGDETTVPVLIEALDDKAAGVREFAAKALGEIGDSQAMEPLIDALEDKSNFVRLEAVKALEGIADERAISPLVKSLKDSELRQNAANALAEIGKPELVDEALEKHRSILQRAGTYEFPEAYAQLGRAYKEREMYDAAIAAYEEAAKRASDSYRRRDYARNLVECYMETGEKEKTATEYLSMIKMSSAGGGGIFMSHSDGTVERLSDREWAIRDFIESFQRQGRLGEFSEILETKLSELPKDVGLHETLGSIYEKQGINEEAISMYEKVAELQPYNMKNRARLALAYNRAGMADKAVMIAKEMSEKGGDASTQSVMAKVFLDCKMYDEAVEAYKKAVSMAQGNWDRRGYQFGLAKCYDDAGKYTEAAAEYEKIAKTATDSYYQDLAERQLWEVYSKGNLYDAAIEKYQKMVEANPKDVKAHEFLGKVYQMKGELKEAIAEYEEITKLKPDDARAFELLGDVYKTQDDFEKAVDYYKQAIDIALDNSSLHVKLGDLYREQDMLDEAIAEYDASQTQTKTEIEQGSTNPWLYNNLAWFYIEKNMKPKESVFLAKKALELAPGNGTMLDTLGWAYLRNGQFDEALKTFPKVFAGEPHSVSSWKGVSEVTQSSVKPEVFLQFFDDMAEMASKDAGVNIRLHATLAQFYEHQGEKEKAQKEWAKIGFVRNTNWLVLGPLDNTGGVGFSKAYPPEEKIDVHATYQGQMAWTQAKDEAVDAYIDFYKMFKDNQWKVAYAVAQVISPTEHKAQLKVGSDDDVKVWLNGEEVLSKNVPRSAAIDQDIVPIILKSGTNDILVKVCNRTGDWGFYLRITDTEGNPYTDLQFVATSEMLTSK